MLPAKSARRLGIAVGVSICLPLAAILESIGSVFWARTRVRDKSWMAPPLYTDSHGSKPIPLPPRLGGSIGSEMIQNWSRIGGRAGSTNKPLPNHYQTTTKPPPKHNRWNRAAGGPGLARRGLGFPPETVAELPRKYFPGEVLEINGSRVAPGCRRRATAGRPAVRPSDRMIFPCHFPPRGLCRTARKFPPGASR